MTVNLTPAMNQPHHDFSEWEGFRKGDWNFSPLMWRDFIPFRTTPLSEGGDFCRFHRGAGRCRQNAKDLEPVPDLMKQENVKGSIFCWISTPRHPVKHYLTTLRFIDKANELDCGPTDGCAP